MAAARIELYSFTVLSTLFITIIWWLVDKRGLILAKGDKVAFNLDFFRLVKASELSLRVLNLRIVWRMLET